MKRLMYSPMVVAAGAAGLVLVSSATALAFWVVRGDDDSHVTLAAAELPAGGQPVGTVELWVSHAPPSQLGRRGAGEPDRPE